MSRKIPQDAVLEQALRKAVTDARNSGSLESLSVNAARAAAEQQLGINADFFKSSGKWKARSKQIIGDAVNNEPEHPQLASPVKIKSSKAANPATKAATSTTTKREAKRASVDAEPRPQKRRKTATSSEESQLSDDATSEHESESKGQAPNAPLATKGRGNRRTVVESDSDEDGFDTRPDGDKLDDGSEEDGTHELEQSAGKPSHSIDGDVSESDMSVVIDEPPPKRKRQKDGSGGDKDKSSAKAKPAKAPTSKTQDLGPDEAEIKRLQSWLLKCGIRKLWHKELASYDSPKAKIKHLKDMLKNAGMDGRYSAEKASQIKEQRELAADLEAVKEGAKKWGHGNDSDEAEDGEQRPRRRGAAAHFVDFGDDGEESE